MSRKISNILDETIGFNVYRVAQLFRNELQHALASYSLTPEQWQVMQTLWTTDDELNQNQIAQLTLKDKHNVSRMLVRMEKNEWVKRKKDPADARAYLIESTEKGKAKKEEVRSKLMGHFSAIFEHFDPKELDQFLETLQKFRTCLNDNH